VCQRRDQRAIGRGLPLVHPRGVLLADAPVDALAEQVGVPVVAGVLLDHVNEQLTQRDRLTPGVAAGEAEIVVAREPLSEGDLLASRRPRRLDHSRVSDRPLKSASGSVPVW
jgi:hypothetical protein